MSAHTAEPWEFGSFYYPESGLCGHCEITQSGEMGILAKVMLPVKGRSGHKEGQANVRRIVACVNACAGMPEPAAEIARLKEDRGDLLTALKGLMDEYEDRKSQFGDNYLWEKHEGVERIEAARAAITKAEKGTSK